VVASSDATGYRRILDIDEYLFIGNGNGNNNFASLYGSGSWNDTSTNSPAQSLSKLSLISVTNDNTTATPYVNGVAQNTKNGQMSSEIGLFLGSERGTTQFWVGKIAEVIIFDATLSDTNRHAIEAQLAAKWGMFYDLPLDHPVHRSYLATASEFDFENNASDYSIRVRAIDEKDASVESSFSISLLDGFENNQSSYVTHSASDLEMIWVEPGTFSMGSPDSETGRYDNETQHDVTLTKGFYLGKYEVTQAQYEKVMAGVTGDLNATPSNWHGNPDRPVEKVSWDDIKVFLTRLNDQEKQNLPAGWEYVLPTEAQWEYACRAGTTTAYSWGDTITSTNANYNWDGEYNTGADFQQTRDVGLYAPNSWGFFDMHGNVFEWVADWLADYSTESVLDPEGPSSGDYKVGRGGSWYDIGRWARSSRRVAYSSDGRSLKIGFRLALRDVNKVPSNLNFTSPLTISENQPAGTVVADFNATDTSDDVLSFRLIHGLGDGNNSAFSIDDSTGELSTAQVFDYEVDSQSLAIRIRVTDSHGFHIENNFTVSLTNVDEDVDGDGTEDHYDDNIDGDAFSNTQEYEVGTDAYDPQSYPLDFFYGYRHVLESDVEDYVVYSNSIKKITEWQTVPNTYWSPKTGGYEGQMVYHFPFEEPVTDLFLKGNIWHQQSTS